MVQAGEKCYYLWSERMMPITNTSWLKVRSMNLASISSVLSLATHTSTQAHTHTLITHKQKEGGRGCTPDYTHQFFPTFKDQKVQGLDLYMDSDFQGASIYSSTEYVIALGSSKSWCVCITTVFFFILFSPFLIEDVVVFSFPYLSQKELSNSNVVLLSRAI